MEDKVDKDQNKPEEVYLTKKYLIAYIAAVIFLLLGVIITYFEYAQNKNITDAIKTSKMFFITSVEIFLYFRLTQETKKRYAINSQKALFYCVAAGIVLYGLL